MWVHLGGSYWQRASYDAVITIGAVLLLFVTAPTFRRWKPDTGSSPPAWLLAWASSHSLWPIRSKHSATAGANASTARTRRPVLSQLGFHLFVFIGVNLCLHPWKSVFHP